MRPTGPVPADIALVGDFPSSDDILGSKPLIGQPGRILDNALARTGLLRTSCFATNILSQTPPNGDLEEWMSDNKKCPQEGWVRLHDKWVHPYIIAGWEELQRQLAEVQPRIVVAMGSLALWLLTHESGIDKWRGSRLQPPHHPFTVVPTLHPRSILQTLDNLPVFSMDIARVAAIYEGRQLPRRHRFGIAPSFQRARRRLLWLLGRASRGPMDLAGDIETRAGFITCIGFAWSETDAICIPLIVMRPADPFYYTPEQEAELIYLIRRLFLHPNITHVGQNYLYDCQYYYRHWRVMPLKVRDTMIGHHSIYSNLRKGLGFLSSMYCHDHVYWKDEGKNWDPKLGERQQWTYNAKDAVSTFEADKGILEERDKHGVQQHFAFQQSLFFPVLRIIHRGLRIDKTKRLALKKELLLAQFQRQEALNHMAGHPLNVNSPKKLIEFFYKDLGIPGIRHLARGTITTDSSALEQIANREPLLNPLLQCIAELRSIKTFLATFIDALPDVDGRMRTAFSIAGPITFRFDSKENAFNSGMNFQNIPKEEKRKLTRTRDYIHLPNIRELFIPDPGCTFFDMDLDRADLQVVVWEAADSDLKFALREGLDMHLFNAMQVWNLSIPVDELKEGHPNYEDHKLRHGRYRQMAKQAVHATNYGVGDRKLAITLGISVAEASRFRNRWFAAHPGIRKWHERTQESAVSKGYIENPFGARLNVLGRIDLPQLLGWLPQSTVARVINTALVRIDDAFQAETSRVQTLLQVHDSLGGQFPTQDSDKEIAFLRRAGSVVIPYDDPLVIPVGIKTSTISWGHCK